MKCLVTFSVEVDKPWMLNLHRLLQLSYSLEDRSPWDKAADKAKEYYPLKLVILCKLLTRRQCISQMGVFIIRQYYVFNTVREQGWELLKILVELRQVHPINMPATLDVACDSGSHCFVCSFQILSFLQLTSSELMQEKASGIGTPEPLGKSTGRAVSGHMVWVAHFLLTKPNLLLDYCLLLVLGWQMGSVWSPAALGQVGV